MSKKLNTRCGVWCQCLLDANCVYYGLKCCIDRRNQKNNITETTAEFRPSFHKLKRIRFLSTVVMFLHVFLTGFIHPDPLGEKQLFD